MATPTSPPSESHTHATNQDRRFIRIDNPAGLPITCINGVGDMRSICWVKSMAVSETSAPRLVGTSREAFTTYGLSRGIGGMPRH